MSDHQRQAACDRSRSTAYAAVTAHLEQDQETEVTYVHELVREPVDAAGVLFVLIEACGALAGLWGRAICEDPAKAWATYTRTVTHENRWRG